MQESLLVIAGNGKSPNRGLSAALKRCPGIDRIAAVQNLAELHVIAAENKIAVLIMDASLLGDADGKSLALQKPGGSNVQTRCLVFYDELTLHAVVESIGRGARGCLRKDSTADEWRKAIQIVLRGGMWFPQPLLSDALVLELGRMNTTRAQTPEENALTSREREIRECVTEGMTNKEIARWLGISPTTVKTHLQHMFGKLHINHRVLLMRGGNSSMV